MWRAAGAKETPPGRGRGSLPGVAATRLQEGVGVGAEGTSKGMEDGPTVIGGCAGVCMPHPAASVSGRSTAMIRAKAFTPSPYQSWRQADVLARRHRRAPERRRPANGGHSLNGYTGMDALDNPQGLVFRKAGYDSELTARGESPTPG